MLHLFSSASSVATELLRTKLFFLKENAAKRKAGTCWVGLGLVWRVGEGGVWPQCCNANAWTPVKDAQGW